MVEPIVGRELLLPSDVVALVAEATAAISRFDAEVGHELAHFSSLLLRSESASSSMIEGLTSGARAIALAELGSTEKRNATLVVGNVRAMEAALALADELDPAAVLAMHRALMAGPEPAMAGRWRSEQVWIGGDSVGPHGAAYVAPHHTHVPALMSDLMQFAAREDILTLAHAAVAHAQFETVHPFPHGNGRTGRALIHAMLRSREVTRYVTVPVSAGLLVDTRAYFDALVTYRDGDPVPIVERVAWAALESLANGRALASELRGIRASWDDRIQSRKGAAAWRLADGLLSQPVMDLGAVARVLGTATANAQRAVQPLVAAGVLTEFTGLRRNRLWQAGEVLAALDGFTARAGRRSLP